MAKESSKKEQGVASFEYNPADGRFPLLFELARPLDDLEKILPIDFAGRRLTARQVCDEHNVGRPYIWPNYQEALRKLEEKRAIIVDPPASARPKRKGIVTFAEKTLVEFPRRGE